MLFSQCDPSKVIHEAAKDFLSFVNRSPSPYHGKVMHLLADGILQQNLLKPISGGWE